MSENQIQPDAAPPGRQRLLPTAASVDAVRAVVYQDLASYPTVAEALGIAVRSVQNLVARGELQIVHIGRQPYVVLSSLKDMVARQQRRHEPPSRGRRRKRT